MTKIVLYIATSHDGYIADEKGSVDFLPQTVEETGGQDYGYPEFYSSVDALVLGRRTYEQILGFGAWPYPGKRSYVFSRSGIQSLNDEITVVQGDISSFIRELEEQNVQKLWVVGGSELIDAFYTQGRIDEWIVTVFPMSIQKGIPLTTLRNALQSNELRRSDCIEFEGGVFQNHYVTQGIG